MAGLKNTTISGGYKSLLRLDDNNGVTSSIVRCTDGDGVASSIKISENNLQVRPGADGDAFRVDQSGGSEQFRVNTTVPYVRALMHYVNTQYAYFGANYVDVSSFAANTHYPISFMAANGGTQSTTDVDFGTGTDPDTTFTTADTDTQYASQLVPMLWHIPDNITIDDVYAFVGADAATGDTTRIHLFQYTFTSGSTTPLSSGSVVAHSTSDTTNAGNEQIYKTTLTKDVTDIDADKVILAFLRSDSVNSDYSINITVKYHLR